MATMNIRSRITKLQRKLKFRLKQPKQVNFFAESEDLKFDELETKPGEVDVYFSLITPERHKEIRAALREGRDPKYVDK